MAASRRSRGHLACGIDAPTLTIIDVASGSSARRTSGTRAKDSDRNSTCAALDTALAEGQLSMTEHGERVKAATTAATLGELQTLVADLQIAAPPITLSPPERRRLPVAPGWGIRAAIAGVLVVLGIAIGWGLYGNTPSPLNFTSDPVRSPTVSRQRCSLRRGNCSRWAG